MRASRGFTLAELLIVVAIMGAMAGMAAFTIRYTGGNSFTVQKAELMEALTLARNSASLRSECVRVRIEGNVYTADNFRPDTQRRCNGPFTGVPEKSHPTIDFGARNINITPFSTGGTEIVFNITGGLVQDQIVTFQMADQHERANFRIYPAIGQIRAE